MKEIRLALCFVIAFLGSNVSHACCVLAPGENPLMGDQINLIVWDAYNKIERFIRSASLETGSSLAGFIAPTPSIPKIKKSSGEALTLMRKWAEEVKDAQATHRDTNSAPAPSAQLGVDVVQTVTVGEYTASTVAATDVVGLKKWMNENQFGYGDGFDSWAKHYLDKKWYLTLFKVNRLNSGGLNTGAIELEFKTEQPFNPYYVPKFNSAYGRALQLFFLAEAKYRGMVANVPWQPLEMQIPLDSDRMEQLKKLLGGSIPIAKPVLFGYATQDFARGAMDDIFFTRTNERFMEFGQETRLPDWGKYLLYGIFGALGIWGLARWIGQNAPSKITNG